MAEKQKILVVEDEEILLAGLKEELAGGGYEVEGAMDGIEGLEKAKSFKPDLILLDLLMPKMDGMEMLQRLKTNEEYKDLKDVAVVVLTNLSDYEKISEALSLGAMDYLVKANYKLEDLLDKVRMVLARK